MFVKFVLLCYLCLLIHDKIQKIKFPSKPQEAKQEEEQDLFQHALLVEYGIKRPLQEVELEEVLPEEVPACWSVHYNERVDNYKTKILIE